MTTIMVISFLNAYKNENNRIQNKDLELLCTRTAVIHVS